MKIAQRLVVVILSAGAALAQTAPAQAGFITGVNALNGLGKYEGTFDYNPVDATHGTLKITLKNTSPAANGGFLTGFVFNNPGQHITGATVSSSNLHFHLLGGPSFNNSVNGAPYGRFDLGASTFKSFEGGGNPGNGIAVGHSADFTFHLTGKALNSLATNDFFTTFSVPPGNGESDQSFVARFRGFEDGGSDKVPGTDPPIANPEPATLLMTSVGLAALITFCWLRQRRMKRRPAFAL